MVVHLLGGWWSFEGAAGVGFVVCVAVSVSVERYQTQTAGASAVLLMQLVGMQARSVAALCS